MDEVPKLVMVSPVIPLPPLIPVSDNNDTVAITLLPTANLILNKLSILDPKGNQVLFEKHGEILHDLPKIFTVSSKCSDLQGKQLTLFFIETTSKEQIEYFFDFKYTDEGSSFTWGFLGA